MERYFSADLPFWDRGRERGIKNTDKLNLRSTFIGSSSLGFVLKYPTLKPSNKRFVLEIMANTKTALLHIRRSQNFICTETLTNMIHSL